VKKANLSSWILSADACDVKGSRVFGVWGWAANVVHSFLLVYEYQRRVGTPLFTPSVASGSAPSIGINSNTKSTYNGTLPKYPSERKAMEVAAMATGKAVMKVLLAWSCCPMR
jgi:hypothetical protein